MDTIVEEDEKEVPLGWWSVDKKGPKIEIQIPLGDANQPSRGRRHSLNLPRSPLASETSPRPKFVPSVPTVKTKQQLNINASHSNAPGSKSLSATTTTQPTSPNALRLHKFLHNNQSGIPEEDIEENSPRGAPLSLAHVPSHRSRDSRRNSDGDFTPALPKAVFLREMAEREIIETETAYVKDLNICIEEFLLPMRSKEILAKQEMEDIFINIEAIANIHEELEKDLRAHANIPRTFQKMTPFLRMYSSYCGNGTKSLETLIKCKKNPAVEKFLVQCITKESVRGQPLESYLIKPTQRLCKYPLLLQALLSNTESGTTEYKELEQVLDQIKSVVLVVNEKKRQVETLQMIEELKSQIVGGVGELFAKTCE